MSTIDQAVRAQAPERSLLFMMVMAIATGAVAGVGAWAFRMLIGLVHNVLFLGDFSFAFDANAHTPPSPWGVGVVLVPVVGALAVAWLVKNFAPEAKGHGVPEVMDAIYYHQGRIRPRVAVVKSLASAISIGSGGSVGREGPIVQIGSAFGSTLGEIIPMRTQDRITLIAAGAGAGIAATFNAPLGGIAFAIELLLVSVNARNLVVVATATAFATHISRLLLGTDPSFHIPALETPDFYLTQPWGLVAFFVLGGLMGLLSVAFIRGLYGMEDLFDAIPGNYYTRHMLGMLGVGVMMVVLARYAGHYYVQGVGYATIMDLLEGSLSAPWFLLLLVALKLLATCLSLGSGASGGVFSPALFMGAAGGAAFGFLCQWLIPGLDVEHSDLRHRRHGGDDRRNHRRRAHRHHHDHRDDPGQFRRAAPGHRRLDGLRGPQADHGRQHLHDEAARPRALGAGGPSGGRAEQQTGPGPDDDRFRRGSGRR